MVAEAIDGVASVVHHDKHTDAGNHPSCSGNQTFGTGPIAEVFASAGGRCFREPGVEYPGLGMPPIPTWDGNPEALKLDLDTLGLPNELRLSAALWS